VNEEAMANNLGVSKVYYSQPNPVVGGSLSIEIEKIWKVVKSAPDLDMQYYIVQAKENKIIGSNVEVSSPPTVPENLNQPKSIIRFLTLHEITKSKQIQQ
jgi:hypothetical protein